MTGSCGGCPKTAASFIVQEESLLVDDHCLMEQVGRGDAVAFEILSKRHLKTMIFVAQRILGNAHEADEVVQEAFLRLWVNASKWDPHGLGSVKTWLSRVVTNLCLDRCRRRRSVPLEDAGDIEDPAQGAFETLGQKDCCEVVQEMLNILPARQRASVILSYFEEMSDKEVAFAMKLTVGAVESLLVRARRSLRQEVKRRGLVWGEDI